MYPGDHRPPHFHVAGPDFQVLVAISDLRVLAGSARQDQIRAALAWADQNREQLVEIVVQFVGTRLGRTMKSPVLPRIAAVSAEPSRLVLRVHWQGVGSDSRIDVAAPIATYRLYRPLRDDPDLFAQVRVGEHGTDIVWRDGIDMAADLLWRLAIEQGVAPKGHVTQVASP
jgi:hypothetical protein